MLYHSENSFFLRQLKDYIYSENAVFSFLFSCSYLLLIHRGKHHFFHGSDFSLTSHGHSHQFFLPPEIFSNPIIPQKQKPSLGLFPQKIDYFHILNGRLQQVTRKFHKGLIFFSHLLSASACTLCSKIFVQHNDRRCQLFLSLRQKTH